MTVSKAAALSSLRPNAQFVIRGGVIEFYQHDDPQPTEEELQSEIIRLNEAQPLNELREERNRRLAQTDWEVLRYLELGFEVPADVKAYRQSLRDLPASTPDPRITTWPTR